MRQSVRSIRSIFEIPILAAVLTASLVSGTTAAAVPPDRIHYQGVLRDSANNPLDGKHDMVFRFFDADVGGNEILVDAHDALGGLPVTVSGGPFGVDLGVGALTDGSGPGAYSSLAEVFRDHSATWVSIEVDGEVLSPRLEVISAGYALTADHLDGMDSTSFLTSESDPQVGVLTATKWCSSDGSAIDCTEEVPVALEVDPQVGSTVLNRVPQWGGAVLVDSAIYETNGKVLIRSSAMLVRPSCRWVCEPPL